MEERNDWGGAFATAWGNLTGVNNNGSVAGVRLMIFGLFLVSAGWAMYHLYLANGVYGLLGEDGFLEEKYTEPSGGPDPSQGDRGRLNNMLNQVKTTSASRQSSPSVAMSMERTLAKYPFADPTIIDQAPPDTPIDPDKPPVVVEVIDYPPSGIVLRAVMIMGNQRVAVMDIPGVGNGLVVKAGDTFAQRKGRVVRIATDRVVIRWGNRNWDIRADSF
ncbi:MAG: hypothetical protein LBD04_03930 [Synergistaceae bacterium]|jgi:Tfp pilus assembly protein PilP|nr:hypothetical protein [Synergistaceae bacterium]